jgi:hypothetical protein
MVVEVSLAFRKREIQKAPWIRAKIWYQNLRMISQRLN